MNAYLNLFTNKSSRQAAIDYIQKPSGYRMLRASFFELGAQWTDPEKVVGALSVGAAGLSAIKGSFKNLATKASRSEIKSGRYLAERGNSVLLRDPTGIRRASGSTSDLLVNGRNFDVYTPNTTNASRIISSIYKKNNQAVGVVVDLTQTSVTKRQLGNIMKRLKGKARSEGKALNIKRVVIIEKF